MLRRFLDTFGFDYEFASATDYYKSGKFDDMLLRALEKFDDIMGVMLPTLGEERQATYSALPADLADHGPRALRADEGVNARHGTITFADEDGDRRDADRVPVAHPSCNGSRISACAGRHLASTSKCSARITRPTRRSMTGSARSLAAEAPEHYVYELFLDDKGQKISKSKGNGLTIDEWLTYADPNSLSLFMYNKPREAKRLYFDVIPRAVDDYAAFLSAYQRQADKPADQLMNPVWHIHRGKPPPPEEGGISFSLLLNLAAVANAEDKIGAVGLHPRYAPHLSPETHPRLDALTGYALRYFDDFVKPKKQYRLPTEDEAKALADLAACAWRHCPSMPRRRTIQQKVYDIGRRDPYKTTQKDGSIGRGAGLVQHALPGAARRREGPALRLVRRPLRHHQHPAADRQGGGGGVCQLVFTGNTKFFEDCVAAVGFEAKACSSCLSAIIDRRLALALCPNP